MATLKDLQENWEDLAQMDPLWAICADPHKRNHNWDEKEFFETGRREIAKVLERMESLGISLEAGAPVLDFGCGVGRLTSALAEHFQECWGVDISPTMIQKARDFNRHNPRCNFWLNEADDLKKFTDGYFGFIYTSIVLQHIQPRYARNYIRELIRVLKPGGVMVFQIVDRFKASLAHKLRVKLAFRRRFESLLPGKSGKLSPQIIMHCMPEGTLHKLLADCKVDVKDVKLTNSAEPSFNGNLQYLEQEPDLGFVSKQYSVVKNHAVPDLPVRTHSRE